MTAPQEVVVPEARPVSAKRTPKNPAISMTATAHAACFIIASIAMMTQDYISVVHRLYLAFLASGLVAWGVLLVAGLCVMAGRQLTAARKREPQDVATQPAMPAQLAAA